MKMLDIVENLIWYDGPQLFLAHITIRPVFDQTTCLCLSIKPLGENGLYEYLAVVCDEISLNNLKSDKIDLRDFFNVPTARIICTDWKDVFLIEERQITDEMLLETGANRHEMEIDNVE